MEITLLFASNWLMSCCYPGIGLDVLLLSRDWSGCPVVIQGLVWMSCCYPGIGLDVLLLSRDWSGCPVVSLQGLVDVLLLSRDCSGCSVVIQGLFWMSCCYTGIVLDVMLLYRDCSGCPVVIQGLFWMSCCYTGIVLALIRVQSLRPCSHIVPGSVVQVLHIIKLSLEIFTCVHTGNTWPG